MSEMYDALKKTRDVSMALIGAQMEARRPRATPQDTALVATMTDDLLSTISVWPWTELVDTLVAVDEKQATPVDYPASPPEDLTPPVVVEDELGDAVGEVVPTPAAGAVQDAPVDPED